MLKKRRDYLELATALICLAGAPTVCIAGPEGGVVQSGQASIQKSGPETTVRQQSHRVDLSWQGFDVLPGESVQFLQPSASAIALNRIVSARPTNINGSLSANGQVWLQNPQGILFGPNAQVDVGGLLATTSQISRQDFAAGNDLFATPGGPISQQGTISAGNGGVAFVAPVIDNTGDVIASGDIALHAGGGFTVDFDGDGLMSLKIAPEDPIAVALSNSGRIATDGGIVHLSAAEAATAEDSVLSLGGLVEATGFAESDGAIYLTGAGNTEITGTIAARRGTAGGEIVTTGEQIVLRSGARLDASAAGGGGRIDLGGREAATPTRRLGVERGATVAADATERGNAGEIYFWSEEVTDFKGFASAAGLGIGDGGFIEISSANQVNYTGTIGLVSNSGNNGQLLFDPREIIITSDQSARNDNDDGVDSIDYGKINFDSSGLGDELDGVATLSKSAVEQIEADILFQASEAIIVRTSLEFENQNVIFDSGRVNFEDLPKLAGNEGSFKITGTGGLHINASNSVSINAPIYIANDRSNVSEATPGSSSATAAIEAGALTIDPNVKFLYVIPCTLVTETLRSQATLPFK